MSQVLFRGCLQSILIVSFVMATLSVYYSNVCGYLQGFPELCAAALSLRPDFIALVETHPADESLQMYLPAGYIVAARHDRTRCGGVF